MQEEDVLRLGLYAPAFRIFETWISEKPRRICLSISQLVDLLHRTSGVTSAWRIKRKSRGSGKEERVCKPLVPGTSGNEARNGLCCALENEGPVTPLDGSGSAETLGYKRANWGLKVY